MRSCHYSFYCLVLVIVASHAYDISLAALSGKKILVVGGSGRVGGSVVTQLIKNNAQVVVGGTSQDRFEEARQRWIRLDDNQDNSQSLLSSIGFTSVDREVTATVTAALETQPFDAVVHTAGPFQGKVKTPNGVIEACVAQGIPYIDVCDDYCTARAAKTKYAAQATSPCIVSTGCWPGVSSLMAKRLVQKTLQARPELTAQDLSVDFSFFTAGSGGAGITLLVATFLILAEKALQIKKGRRMEVNAMRDYETVNFGSVIGNRDIAPLNLLETASVHDVLGVGSVSSRFGTAPNFWNALLGAMAQLPSSLLANEDIMRKLSVFSMPIVRLVDAFAGATNSMRCDVTSSADPGLRATAIYGHENLEPCVGECVVAFVCAVLTEGAVPPGVWFPEEAMPSAAGDDAAVLSIASRGAHTIDVEAQGFDIETKDVWGEAVNANVLA